MSPLNQWALDHLSKTISQYKKQFDSFEYSHALEAVDSFFWQLFCDNYIELVKDQFFNPTHYDPEVIYATKFTAYEIGFALLQLYAPFLPHVTENIYQVMYQTRSTYKSLHQTLLDETRWAYSFPESSQLIRHVLTIIDHVRKLKSEHHVSLKTSLQELIISVDNPELQAALERESVLIAGVTKAERITYQRKAIDAPTLTQVDGRFIATVQV